MEPVMKASPLMRGIFFAFVSSLVSCIIYYALAPFFTANFLIKLISSMLSFSYIVYLLYLSKERVGRVTVLVLWTVLVITVGYFLSPISLFILTQLIAIWLIRSLYYYSSFIASFADLLLNGLSVASAFLAFNQTGSLFLTLWCFFLTQALFVLIPNQFTKQRVNKSPFLNNDNNFQQAYRTAEVAVKQLSTQA
jgi:hypothetical protein